MKFYCEFQISSKLEIKNVIDIYQYADLHNAASLKQNCLNLMASNFTEIVQTEKWETFIKLARKEEIIEVTRAFSKFQISKQETEFK